MKKKIHFILFIYILIIFSIYSVFAITLPSGLIIKPDSNSSSGEYTLVYDVEIIELIVDDVAYFYTDESQCTVKLVNFDTRETYDDAINASLGPTDTDINLEVYLQCGTGGGGGGDAGGGGGIPTGDVVSSTRGSAIFDFSDLPDVEDDPVGWVMGFFAKAEVVFIGVSVIIILLLRQVPNIQKKRQKRKQQNRQNNRRGSKEVK